MMAGTVSAFFRLFTLQASWTHQRLQGVGVAFASQRLLRGGAGSENAAYRAALGRAAQYFNTHPYLSGLAVGALSKAEVEGVDPRVIERFRNVLKGPLGLIGDRLIWAGVLPLTAAIGLGVWARGFSVVAPLVFLVAFNAVHLVVRAWALQAGLRLGMSAGGALKNPVLQTILRVVGPCAMIAVGLALPLVWERLTAALVPDARWWVLGVAGLGVAIQRWIAPTLGPVRWGLIAVAAVLTVGWIWP